MLYVLVCGKVPFDDQSMPALHAKIKRGFVEYPSTISADCKDLLSRMLVVDPANRATLQEIRHHPWMVRGYDRPPDSYIPDRRPLRLPLDPVVIHDMSGFEFGDEEQIAKKLAAILESPRYLAACKEWYRVRGIDMDTGGPLHSGENGHDQHRRSRHFSIDFYRRRSFSGDDVSDPPAIGAPSGPMRTPDPTNAYHPLISIYYLVQEKQERMRKSKLEEDLKQAQVLPHSQQLQQQQQPQQQQAQPSVQTQSAYHQQAYNTPQARPASQQAPIAQEQQAQAQQQQRVSPQSPPHRHSALQPTSPGTPTPAYNYQPLVPSTQTQAQPEVPAPEEKRFLVPTIPAPEAVHTSPPPSHIASSAYAQATQQQTTTQQAQSKVRARARTQGESDSSDKLFVFGSNNSRNNNINSAHPPSTNTGSSFTSNLLRRFSSKRKTRDVSAPTNIAYTQPQPQPQAARPQTRHQHSQSAAPAFADLGLDDGQTNIGRASTTSNRLSVVGTAVEPHQAYNSQQAQQLARSSSSKPYPKSGFLDPNAYASQTISGPPTNSYSATTATAGPSAKTATTGSLNRKFHPSARAKSLGHVRNEQMQQGAAASAAAAAATAAAAASAPPRPPREDLAVPSSSGTATPSGSADIADEFFDEYYGNDSDATGGRDSSSENTSNQVASNTNTNTTLSAPARGSGAKGSLGPTASNAAQLQKQASNTSATGQQITTTTSTGPPGSMLSIDYPKQVFLKGFFSVQSTSTKPLAYIRSDIIRVLNQLGVEYQEIRGGFSCIHRPSLREDVASGNMHSQQYLANSGGNAYSPPQSPQVGDAPQRGHWRKLSFGSGFFSNRRSRHQNESTNNVFDFSSDMSTDSVGGYNNNAGGTSAVMITNSGGQPVSQSSSSSGHIATAGSLGSPQSPSAGSGGFRSAGTATSSTPTGNGSNTYNAGGSDMLASTTGAPVNNVSQVRTPLQFEIWIVLVPILKLHGVQFKKLRGNSWLYKNLATKILSELRL